MYYLFGLKHLLENAAAALAAAGTSIAAIDYFLSKSQREWLDYKNTQVYVWLDDQKPSKRLELYKTRNMFDTIVFYGPITYAVVSLIFSPLMGGADRFLQAIGGILFGLLNIVVFGIVSKIPFIYKSAFKAYIFVLSARHLSLVFFRIFACQFIYLVFCIISVILLHIVIGPLVSEETFIVIFLIFGITIVPIFSSFFAACSLLLSIVNIIIISIIYKATQWFVEKVADTNKGVVLGMSAVLGALSTSIKAFF